MKIRTKLVLSFLTVAMLVLVVGFVSAWKSREILEDTIGQSSVSFAREALDKIDRAVFNRIEEMQVYCKDETLQIALKKSNKEFGKIDNIKSYIDEIDREWTSLPEEVLSVFMRRIMNTELSVELKEKAEFYQEKYGYRVFAEIFVTNKYGANIAQTGKTSDYRQDDEEWWQNARKDGFYLAGPGYDESADVYSIDICLRVNDANGNFLGVMKTVLNIEELLSIVKEMSPTKHKEHAKYWAYGHEGHKSMKFMLLTGDGKIVATAEKAGFLENASDKLLSSLEETSHAGTISMDYFIVEGYGYESEKLLAHAHSQGHRDFKGLGWFLVVEHETEEIFKPVTDLWNFLMAMISVVTALSVLLGLLISRSVAAPIIGLEKKMSEVGEGNLDITVEIKSNDEVGSLAKSFNNMLENLKKSTTSIEDLNEEIIERVKIEEELRQSGEESKALLQDIEQAKEEWEATMDCIQDMIILVDKEGLVRRCNQATRDFFNFSYDDILGRSWIKLCRNSGIMLPARTDQHDVHHMASGRWFSMNQYRYSGSEDVLLEGQRIKNIIKFHEISLIKKIGAELEKKNKELQEAYEKLKATQAKILQSEKMASIGQLAAGVAHEINNPMGFISSNIRTLDKYVGRLVKFIDAQSEVLGTLQALDRVADTRKKLKLDYIIEDTRDLIEESLDGAERVKKIVQNLKTFSRVDQAEEKMADINECLETTLNIVWNELKYKTTVNKEYGDLPLTKCYPQQLNQVFMNILINAAQAIDEQGEITIRTWQDNDTVKIAISDTGSGIPEDKVNKIFEPFFTTKEVGKGTGLGLSICYDIVESHKGEITVESEEGKGTTFTITIPAVGDNDE